MQQEWRSFMLQSLIRVRAWMTKSPSKSREAYAKLIILFLKHKSEHWKVKLKITQLTANSRAIIIPFYLKISNCFLFFLSFFLKTRSHNVA
jgi:hypothetical protein